MVEYIYLNPQQLAMIDKVVNERLLEQYAGMPSIRVLDSPFVPNGTAYIFKEPPVEFVPFVNPPEMQYEPFRFRIMEDMGVRLGVPRSLLFTADIGDSVKLDAPPRRVPDAPARDFTFWEALVLAAVGAIVLLLLARATG